MVSRRLPPATRLLLGAIGAFAIAGAGLLGAVVCAARLVERAEEQLALEGGLR